MDKDVRHWQNDFYVQDNWRATSRLTLDYGVRFQHSGSDYEVNNNHTGFFPDQWQASQAGAGVPSDLRHRASRETSPVQRPTSAPSILPIRPCSSRPPLPATSCREPGLSPTGSRRMASLAGRTAHTSGSRTSSRRPGSGSRGTSREMARPRFARPPGIFYNFPRSTGTGGYSFAGGCPVSCSNSIRYATFDAVAAAGSGGGPALLQTPQNTNVAGYDQPLAKSYNGNVAFQRDIGFHTTAEIAWVGNYQYEGGRTVDINRLPLLRLREPCEPREQRAAQQQLAESRSTDRTPAWDR